MEDRKLKWSQSPMMMERQKDVTVKLRELTRSMDDMFSFLKYHLPEIYNPGPLGKTKSAINATWDAWETELRQLQLQVLQYEEHGMV